MKKVPISELNVGDLFYYKGIYLEEIGRIEKKSKFSDIFTKTLYSKHSDYKNKKNIYIKDAPVTPLKDADYKILKIVKENILKDLPKATKLSKKIYPKAREYKGVLLI